MQRSSQAVFGLAGLFFGHVHAKLATCSFQCHLTLPRSSSTIDMRALLTVIARVVRLRKKHPLALEFNFNFTRHQYLRSERFIQEPLEVFSLTLNQSVFTRCEFSLFMQHFHFSDSSSGLRESCEKCSLGPSMSFLHTQILESGNEQVQSCQFVDTFQRSSKNASGPPPQNVAGSEPDALSLSTLALVRSLTISPVSDSTSDLLGGYMWPKLECLCLSELRQAIHNETLMKMMTTAPELDVLAVHSEPKRTPDSNSLMFPDLEQLCISDLDWDSLPWNTTGFLDLSSQDQTRFVKIDAQGKCRCANPPALKLGNIMTARLNVELDFSRNNLRKAPDFRGVQCEAILEMGFVEISLNLSFNRLQHSSAIVVENQNSYECTVEVVSLDVSHNNLLESNAPLFHRMTHLKKLYLNHNQFDSVPLRVLSLDQWNQLEFLDISHNPLVCSCCSCLLSLDSPKYRKWISVTAT